MPDLPDPAASAAPAASAEQQALLQALQAIIAPLAELAVARGVHFGTVEEQLKLAFIVAARQAALQATPGALPHRLVSRISSATGINRREVTRLVQADLQQAQPRRSPPVQVFARWTTDPVYLDAQGEPLALPRQGPSPSFETLAASITRDVHPRSLLDGLLRLDLATLDEATDTVSLSRTRFVPRDDQVRMLGFLGGNVGDHLQAAVDNVSGRTPAHVEQAIRADGLSAASLAQLHERIHGQWRTLASALVPEIQRLIDADEAAGAEANGRLRVGLYMYADRAPALAAAPAPTAPLDPAAAGPGDTE